MKKIILILLSFLVALTLVSCERNQGGQGADFNEQTTGSEGESTESAASSDTTSDPEETTAQSTQTQQTPGGETAEFIDKYVEYGTLVDVDALNVRSGAGSAFTRLGVLQKGETVEILEKNCEEADGYTWHKILYQGSVGYVVAGNQTDNFRFEFRHLTSSDDGSVKSEEVSFEKYIGTWRDGVNPPDFFTVIQKDNGEIQCGWGVYRLTSFYFVITAKDGEFTFEDEWGRMSGKIYFIDDSICVKVEETIMEGSWSGHLFTEKEENQSSESPALTFVSRQERLSWKDKIERILSDNHCYEYEKYGDIGVALMDLNFDHTPEVIVASEGGTMGNVNIKAYDLESGETICFLGDTPHYRYWDDIYLCVYGNDKGDYLIVNEGSLRNGLERYNLTSVLNEKNGEFKFDVLFEEVTESDDSRRYYYAGEEVDQIAFEKYYKERFRNEYREIAETKIQIVHWDSIDAKNEDEAISMMAAALVSSEQQFIDYDIDYKEAYLDFLKDKKDSHRAFALVFIDGDEIPELYMSGVCEADGDVICTLRNGVVTLQHLSRNGGGKYVEKSGNIINRNGHMGYYYDHAYKLDENGFTKTLDASYIERYVHIRNDEYDVYCEYFINGYPVSEAYYQNRVNAVFDFSNAISLHDGAVSYDEIVEQLQNGNTGN